MKSKIIEIDTKYQFAIIWNYTTKTFNDLMYCISDLFNFEKHEVTQKAKYVQIDFYNNGKLFNWNILDEDKTVIRTKHCNSYDVETIFKKVILPNT